MTISPRFRLPLVVRTALVRTVLVRTVLVRTVLVRTVLVGAAMAPLSPAHAQLRPVPRRVNQAPAGTHTFRHNGIARSYVVRAPAGLNRNSAPVPVVLVLHGGGGNAANAEQMTGFTRLVERERILVVYPEGTSQRPRIPLLTWNASHCCGHAMKTRVDDVGFINALLDTLSAAYPVDPARVYVTGMSNGGMMSHRLGRELSQRVAAIAPVVGAIFGDEPAPTHPVSAIMINGLLDKSVPSAGGLGGGRGASQWDGTPTRPALEQGTYWARANACAATPITTESGTDRVTRYECPANRRVEVHLLADNGHAWPGGKAGSRMGDTPTTSMDATDVIWTFFASVRKP